jgi:predicted nuclease of predicted toxin-antitoxin system
VVKRVLLDEGVPRQLAAALEAGGFSASAYPSLWKQTKNGELLRLAEREGFDVLVTNDKNIYAQQNLRELNISIIVLPTNLRREVMERAADVIAALKEIRPRQYVVIEIDGRRSVARFDEQRG